MFAKFAIFVASLAVFVAASPLPGGDSDIENSCNTGSIHCCNSVHSAQDAAITSLFALLAFKLGDATGQIGLNCSPITAAGLGGNSWFVFKSALHIYSFAQIFFFSSSQPVCCANNDYSTSILILLSLTLVNFLFCRWSYCYWLQPRQRQPLNWLLDIYTQMDNIIFLALNHLAFLSERLGLIYA